VGLAAGLALAGAELREVLRLELLLSREALEGARRGARTVRDRGGARAGDLGDAASGDAAGGDSSNDRHAKQSAGEVPGGSGLHGSSFFKRQTNGRLLLLSGRGVVER
jgi:hypothetical protein